MGSASLSRAGAGAPERLPQGRQTVEAGRLDQQASGLFHPTRLESRAIEIAAVL